MVSEYDWESDTFTHHSENDVPAAWHTAVAEIAAKAREKLPESRSRIDKAVALVLAGDVTLMPDGTGKIASQSNGNTIYHIANGHCNCRDFERAPGQLCKHRLAFGLARRAQELVKAKLANTYDHVNALAQQQTDIPGETPQGIPPQHVVLIQGRPFVKFAGLLQMAHERGLVSLTADWTYNDGDLSLAHAVGTFQDGRRFEEAGDATPANTNRKVRRALPPCGADQGQGEGLA
jgi:hypothetical protein